MKTYSGWRDTDGLCHITVREDGKPRRALRLRLDLSNHSPTGFEWGYGGSGPAQTALALLADALGDDFRALVLHMDFKWRAVGPLRRQAPWQMTDEQIREIASELEQRRSA